MKTSDVKARARVGDISCGYAAKAKAGSPSFQKEISHTYIYIEREREREREGVICSLWLVGEASAI